MDSSGALGQTRPMRWRPVFGASLLLSATTLLAGGASTVVSFAGLKPGTVPDGFRWLSSAPDERGRWLVERVNGTPALVQAELGQRGYRLAVRQMPPLADVHVGTRLRAQTGDRAAGLAWRIQDEGTYYAARLDLDRQEMELYKFVRGNRIRLDRRTRFRIDPDAWHELVVEHRGTQVHVWLNGVPVLREEDDSIREAGQLGLWMPGDGTAAFERLWYRSLPQAAP